jgi:hypothetical protein
MVSSCPKFPIGRLPMLACENSNCTTTASCCLFTTVIKPWYASPRFKGRLDGQIDGKLTLRLGRSHARRLRRPLGPRFLAAFVPVIVTRIKHRRTRPRHRLLCSLPLSCRPRIPSLPQTNQKIPPRRHWRRWNRFVPLDSRKCRPNVVPRSHSA